MASPTVAAAPASSPVARSEVWKGWLFALAAALFCWAFLTWHPSRYRPLVAVQTAVFVLPALTYLAMARACLYAPWATRTRLFALANIAGLALFLDWVDGVRRALFFLATYLVLILIHYCTMRIFASREDRWAWLAFASPILALVFARYFAFVLDPFWKTVPGILDRALAEFYIGLSYMAFRLSYLVLEVRNKVVPRPTLSEYLGFAMFLPTLSVGPINPYSTHRESLAHPDPEATPAAVALQRILIGAVKYQFLGNIFNQLSYSGLLLDGHRHGPLDVVVAAVCYHLYLYCNFSGFCDLAIGGAGLIGIRVRENFQNPLAARNVQDYWNRWHITLSTYMRDVVFSPLSKALVRLFGPAHANHAIALAILVVFLIVGIWHGAGWRYALYGALHAVGVGANHYYTNWLKRRLGKRGYQAYHDNRLIRWSAVAATFLYVTASLFVFANNFDDMQQIFQSLQF